MRIIQLHIYVLMWCATVTESVTNTAVSLGADVIISCDLDIKEIYWYRHKSPDPPELILRTFRRTSVNYVNYENSIFKDRYSVNNNSNLFIRNISSEELGVYYCVKTSEPLKFSNGTKIFISDSVHVNQTESDDAPPNEILWTWRDLTIITSVLINVLLIITLIALGKSYVQSRRLKHTPEISQSTTAAQYLTDTQYPAVDLSTHPSENRSFQEQGIYSLLQPVKNMK